MIKRPIHYSHSCHWDKTRECTNNLLCGVCEFQPADDDKPNGRREPVPVRWENDYGMMMPYCPSCEEMAYSEERCVFCGQKFIPTEKPQENVREIVGGHADEDGFLRCDECDCDELSMILHEDGANFFGNTYICKRCGNRVSVRTYRIRK